MAVLPWEGEERRDSILNVTTMMAGPSKRGIIGPDDPMPWGKHKGIVLGAVPRDYLVWCLKNMDACNQDSGKFWPEFRETIEALVGPHAPVRPDVLSIDVLCYRLREMEITLEVRGGTVKASEQIDGQLEESLQAHRNILLSVLRVSSGAVKLSGSAKAIQGAEIRCLVKGWYGKLSRQFHPDAGGSPVAFTAVNAGYKLLLEILSQWESSK